MVQWLGLGAFTGGPQVCSLVGGLRSCKPSTMAKRKKKNLQETQFQREVLGIDEQDGPGADNC